MNTFKEFFKANHDYSVFLEMAYREHVVKRPVSIDNEDIDFLYQVDQKDWPEALKTRYDVLYKLLENRDKVRNNIKKELFKEIEKSFGKKKLAGIRDKDFNNKFKKLILDFASKYNDYGGPGPGEFNIIKLTDWLENDLEDYDLRTKMSEIGYRYSDIRNAFKDFVYYTVDAIVPFVKEEKEKFKDSFINFYINRLIQKLETTRGKNYIVPISNEYNPANLPNIKSILPSEVSKKIKLASSGEYGLDLSNVKKTSRGGKQRIGSKSFAFPSENNISNTVRHLLTLNFHRHLGPLPSDENLSSFDKLADEGKFKYKIVRVHGRSKDLTHDQKKKQKDNYIPQQKENGIKNNISRILSKAQSGDYKNWDDPKLSDLWEIIGKSSEATDGSWFEKAGLDNEIDLMGIFGKEPIEINAKGDTLPAWRVAKSERWFRELKTPRGGGVAGNAKLKRKFSEYFAKLVTMQILSSNKQLTPQILSDKDTEEFSGDGHPRIDKEELDQIEKSLTPEQFMIFKKTGRLPYSLKQGGKNPEITIGKNPKTGEPQSAFLMLPTVKHTVDIIDKDGNKIGEKTINLPIINGSRFVKNTPSKLKDSEEDEDINPEDGLESSYSRPITTTRSSSEIKSIEEIEKIYDRNPEKYKGTEIEVAVAAYRSSDSGGIYTYNGKTKNVQDGFVFDDINNKMYSIDDYQHGASGIEGAHFRQEESGEQPETAVKKTARKKLSGVFGQIKDSKDLTPTLIRIGYRSKIGLFSEDPAEGYKPMRWSDFKIVRYGDNYSKDEEGDSEESGSVGTKVRDIVVSNDGDGDIQGYYEIIKGISQCLLSKGARSCGTEIKQAVKNKILNDIDLIEKAHDFIVELLINNISKKDFKEPASRERFTNSELGKVLQSPAFGQKSRKTREDLASSDESGVDAAGHPFRKDSTEKEEKPNLNKLKRDLIEDKFLETIFDFPGKENQAKSLSKGNIDKAREILVGLLEDPEQGIAAKLNEYSGLFQELDGYEKISDQNRISLLNKINKQKNQLLAYLSRLVMGPTSSGARKQIVLDYYQQIERKLKKIPKEIISSSAPEEKVQTIEKPQQKIDLVFSWIKEIISNNMLLLPNSKNLINTINSIDPDKKELEIKKSVMEIATSLWDQVKDIPSINKFIRDENLNIKINKFNFICDSLDKLERINVKKDIDSTKNNLRIVWKDLSDQHIKLKGIRPSTPRFIQN